MKIGTGKEVREYVASVVSGQKGIKGARLPGKWLLSLADDGGSAGGLAAPPGKPAPAMTGDSLCRDLSPAR